MLYDRKIKYLDYLENGERIRGGGFVKLEVSETSLAIDINVKDVWSAREMTKEVYLCGAGREEILGRISIREGQGIFRHVCHMQPEEKCMGMDYDELTGIRIPLGEGREIACVWNRAIMPGKQAVRECPSSSGKAAGTAADISREMRASAETATIWERPGSSEKAVNAAADISREMRASAETATVWERPGSSGKAAGTATDSSREVKASAETATVRESSGSRENTADVQGRGRGSKRAPATVVLQEDKWLQLSSIYPHIKPFQDEREYLSIGPADFVLFPAESYRAVNNSFMLHGYYNYRHLILAREEKGGEIRYYVGAPGNYYDRERQVAIMFGFESFECAQEPAQSADFGYYMMRINI